MKRKITQTAIEAAKPKSKAYEIRDTNVSGFLVRVQPSGRKTYYCEYKRGSRVKIGLYQTLSTHQARGQAQQILAKYFNGEDPAQKRKEERASISYSEFLERYYYPWVDANLRSAYEYRRVLNVNCKAFRCTPLRDFDTRMVEKWRLKLLASGKTPNTVNRIYTNFRASLSKAEEWGLIDEHPLRKMKPIKTPQKSIVRYLSHDEEKRLRAALDIREERKRAERKSANEWRQERGYYLKPMILLSMNTGMRRGEVFKLTWGNVSFDTRQLTISGQTAKSGKTRYIPLNSEAFDVLQKWERQRMGESNLVFSNKDGKPFNTLKKGWAKILISAEIKNFRWHDLRHHFASRLVINL